MNLIKLYKNMLTKREIGFAEIIGFVCFYDENKKYGVLKMRYEYSFWGFYPFSLAENNDSIIWGNDNSIKSGEIVLGLQGIGSGKIEIINANGYSGYYRYDLNNLSSG